MRVFENPTENFVTIYNYKVNRKDLADNFLFSKREFSIEFNEKFFILGRFFDIGKVTIRLKKASVANPRKLRSVKQNEIIDELKLNVFNCQIHYTFDKYTNLERLLKNRQKLKQYTNLLLSEEHNSLTSLLIEPLAEIDSKGAAEVLESLLQYYDFPDRFSVLTPAFEKTRWRVPIALTYPKQEPIWLADAFVDTKTGKVEMKISFEDLLKKGKKKAKEAFSIA